MEITPIAEITFSIYQVRKLHRKYFCWYFVEQIRNLSTAYTKIVYSSTNTLIFFSYFVAK